MLLHLSHFHVPSDCCSAGNSEIRFLFCAVRLYTFFFPLSLVVAFQSFPQCLSQPSSVSCLSCCKYILHLILSNAAEVEKALDGSRTRGHPSKDTGVVPGPGEAAAALGDEF